MEVSNKFSPKARTKGDDATPIDIAYRREAGDRSATVPARRLISILLDAREVKARADFLAIVSRYTKPRRSGRQYLALCFFHSERDPSLYVDPERKLFRCFGCGLGGDLFAFVMRAEGCNFPRAVQIVAEFSSGVAHSGSPRSGERFGVRVEGEALSACAAGEQHSPDSRASILARLDETERVLAAIQRTNDADYLRLARACEPGERSEPLFIRNRITD